MNQQEDARFHFEKGGYEMEEKDFKRAYVSYSRAKRLSKNDIRSHFAPFVMALALEAQKKYKEASTSYKIVTLIDPSFFLGYFNLASVLNELEKNDESIEMYNKAIGLDPSEAVAHENLARVLGIQERYGEAHEHYMIALKLQPSDADYIADGLGILYFRQGMFTEAIEEFQKSINLNGKQANVYWDMSLVLFCERRSQEAEKYFEDGMKTLEEDEKIIEIKETVESFLKMKTDFEAKLNHNEEKQIKTCEIIVGGLKNMLNLLNQQLQLG